MFSFLNLINQALAEDNVSGSPGSVSGGAEPISNPLSVNSIPELVTLLLKIVVNIGLPVVALAIIYVGFMYVRAQGNKDQLTKAHQAFFWTVIGAAVVLGAFAISTIIEGTVDNLKK